MRLFSVIVGVLCMISAVLNITAGKIIMAILKVNSPSLVISAAVLAVFMPERITTAPVTPLAIAPPDLLIKA